MNRRALQAVLKLKPPLVVGPVIQTGTGARVPFYQDSRKLWSHPEIVQVLAQEFAKEIRKLRGQVDCLVGIPYNGIPIALATSLVTKIPFVYVRGGLKPGWPKKYVQGDFKKGSWGVLMDDVLGLGIMKRDMISLCAREGIKTRAIFVNSEAWPDATGPLKKQWAKRGIKVVSFYTREELMSALRARGLLSKEAFAVHSAYSANPLGWHRDRKMWRQFLAWRRRALQTSQF